MSEKKDNSDITRIEDLSEYEHEEDEGLEEDFESSLMDAQTDPNIELPKEFRPDEPQEETDFEELENQDETPEFSTDFGDENSFGEPTDAFSEESSFGEADVFEEAEAFDSTDDFNDFEESDSTKDQFYNENDFEPEPEPEDDSEPETEPEASHADPEEDGPHESFKKASPAPSSTSDRTPIEPLSQEQYKAPETFQELQKFARSIDYGSLAAEGNPPFSIALKGIKYKEDAQDILSLLKEFGAIKEEDLESAQKSLERGSFLIPRLGEYSAITICHKLRRFDVEILMGLTEEVRPPKSYRSDDSGLASKHTIYNSRSHHFQLDKDALDSQDILVATTPYLENHDIIEYISIASENALIDSKTLESSHALEEQLISSLPDYQKSKKQTEQVLRQNYAASRSGPIDDNILEIDGKKKFRPRTPSLTEIQNSLIQKLRLQASQAKGNALIGVNFHVTPLGELHHNNGAQFQVICSGSIVWANKR